MQVKKVGVDMPGCPGLSFGVWFGAAVVNTSVDIILFFWIGLAREQGEEESGKGGGSRNVCSVVGPFWICREVCLGVVVVCWCRLLVCSLGWVFAVALGLLSWVTVVIMITKVTPQRCSHGGFLLVLVLQRTEQ